MNKYARVRILAVLVRPADKLTLCFLRAQVRLVPSGLRADRAHRAFILTQSQIECRT
jgi:hypothetical protein